MQSKFEEWADILNIDSSFGNLNFNIYYLFIENQLQIFHDILYNIY